MACAATGVTSRVHARLGRTTPGGCGGRALPRATLRRRSAGGVGRTGMRRAGGVKRSHGRQGTSGASFRGDTWADVRPVLLLAHVRAHPQTLCRERNGDGVSHERMWQCCRCVSKLLREAWRRRAAHSLGRAWDFRCRALAARGTAGVAPEATAEATIRTAEASARDVPRHGASAEGSFGRSKPVRTVRMGEHRRRLCAFTAPTRAGGGEGRPPP